MDSRLRGNGDEHVQEKYYSLSKLAVTIYPLAPKKACQLTGRKKFTQPKLRSYPKRTVLKGPAIKNKPRLDFFSSIRFLSLQRQTESSKKAMLSCRY